MKATKGEKQFPWCGGCGYRTPDGMCFRVGAQRKAEQEACELYSIFREEHDARVDMDAFYARYPEAVVWHRHWRLSETANRVLGLMFILQEERDFKKKAVLVKALSIVSNMLFAEMEATPHPPFWKENVQ